MQSRNLQFSIYLVKSGKSESRSFFCDNFGKSRVENPGVSTMKVVSFSNLKNRLSVVVWRPRSVFLLTVLVSRTSFPTNKFINVDLPTPLGPVIIVVLFNKYFLNSDIPWFVSIDIGKISNIPLKIELRFSMKELNSSTVTRSILVKISIGFIFWENELIITFWKLTISKLGDSIENVIPRKSTLDISGLSNMLERSSTLVITFSSSSNSTKSPIIQFSLSFFLLSIPLSLHS